MTNQEIKKLISEKVLPEHDVEGEVNMTIEEKIDNLAEKLFFDSKVDGFKVVRTFEDEEKGKYTIIAKKDNYEMIADFQAYDKEDADKYGIEALEKVNDNCYVEPFPYFVTLNGKDIYETSYRV